MSDCRVIYPHPPLCETEARRFENAFQGSSYKKQLIELNVQMSAGLGFMMIGAIFALTYQRLDGTFSAWFFALTFTLIMAFSGLGLGWLLIGMSGLRRLSGLPTKRLPEEQEAADNLFLQLNMHLMRIHQRLRLRASSQGDKTDSTFGRLQIDIDETCRIDRDLFTITQMDGTDAGRAKLAAERGLEADIERLEARLPPQVNWVA